MRVFFALDPQPECKRAIADWRDRFGLASGRPVPPANLHLTLAFVGAIEGGHLERLCLAVDQWLEGARPQAGMLELDRVGFWARPAIFWLGASAVPPALVAQAAELRSRAVMAGARRDRHSWVPHITLYRNCSQPPPTPLQAPAIALKYRSITLFESRQGRQGVSYSPLAEWSLSPPARG